MVKGQRYVIVHRLAQGQVYWLLKDCKISHLTVYLCVHPHLSGDVTLVFVFLPGFWRDPGGLEDKGLWLRFGVNVALCDARVQTDPECLFSDSVPLISPAKIKHWCFCRCARHHAFMLGVFVRRQSSQLRHFSFHYPSWLIRLFRFYCWYCWMQNFLPSREMLFILRHFLLIPQRVARPWESSEKHDTRGQSVDNKYDHACFSGARLTKF